MRTCLALAVLAAAAAAGCSSTGDVTTTTPPAVTRSSAPPVVAALDNAGTGPGGANSAAVAQAVTEFLGMLGATQRTQVLHDLGDDRGRRTWSDHPAAQVPRPGIAFADLSGVQRAAALAVLAEALSDPGYSQATASIPADAHLAVYGTPSAAGPFAIQFGGTHLARNLTYRGDQVSMTPSLTGNDPAEAALVTGVIAALSEQEKLAAQLSTGVSDDLVKGPGQDTTAYPGSEGLLVSELGETVRTKVTALIAAQTGDLDRAAAGKLLDAYRAEYDRTRLAWTDSYVRVDGPHVWIEVLGTVTVFRDKTNDYGSN
ncbi:hypothetical protein ACTI_62980 [Actinoplanes sp. OR16]|uniref:DUF3500 domain-containing protein n=1 Tax=Actinoplanes sp. OR16 TaxID=946334 RepID=UPI000F6B95DD|nr:DUF3500 domain-containing protein [Actinoplanes sp. OR16]BBH69613.1 hypothetical protein ACTI_62980 [Actinoplanes sp. OR16]